MPKIFIVISVLLISFYSNSQILYRIDSLPSTINSQGSEFNFIQINDKTAYYTSSSKISDGSYQSLIFKTSKKNKTWQKGDYINFGDSFSAGNISILNNDSLCYFTSCNKFNYCQIGVKANINSNKSRILKNEVNLTNSTNTHPNIIIFNNKKILYFVSDRKGGYGGMDIWFSIIDDFGNYGSPINAGHNINTKHDEITPFYNIWTGEMFFSSDKKKDRHDFDIYKSKGEGNLWEESLEVKNLNSEQDDLYLNFYSPSNGYFSSNRNDNDVENCCNNIYSFEFISTDSSIDSFGQLIDLDSPISLYFHNDEPKEELVDTITNAEYKSFYVSYFLKQEEYLSINPSEEINLFFETRLKGNYERLNSLLKNILIELKNNEKIEIYLRGYASPLYDSNYNINLSKRRINSLINTILSFRNNEMEQYIDSGNLKIIEAPYGEKSANPNVSDDPKNKEKSIYSKEAMLERKVDIFKVVKL